jgi:hypothetical protein
MAPSAMPPTIRGAGSDPRHQPADHGGTHEQPDRVGQVGEAGLEDGVVEDLGACQPLAVPVSLQRLMGLGWSMGQKGDTPQVAPLSCSIEVPMTSERCESRGTAYS